MERENVITEIIEVLENDEALFNECVEELDEYNELLDGGRYFDMDLLPDMLEGVDIFDVLNMAYFGRDEDSWNEYSSFNPNRNYFKFNGYGNLVSADSKDYSYLLDETFIYDLEQNRYRLEVIDYNLELENLFEKLEELEELEE